MKETAYTGTDTHKHIKDHQSSKREKHHETANQIAKGDGFLVFFIEADGYVHSSDLMELHFHDQQSIGTLSTFPSFPSLHPHLYKYKHTIHNCSFIPRAFTVGLDNT